MRNDWRNYTGMVSLWVMEIVAALGAWIFPRPTKYVFVGILLIAPLAVATAVHWDLLRLRRKIDLVKAEAAAADTAALGTSDLLNAMRESVRAGVNATIVEIVAAQQAVVRASHPDDILLRLTAADDKAHEALTALAEIPAGPARSFA